MKNIEEEHCENSLLYFFILRINISTHNLHNGAKQTRRERRNRREGGGGQLKRKKQGEKQDKQKKETSTQEKLHLKTHSVYQTSTTTRKRKQKWKEMRTNVVLCKQHNERPAQTSRNLKGFWERH